MDGQQNHREELDVDAAQSDRAPSTNHVRYRKGQRVDQIGERVAR
jgi:hypothetical protein